MAEKPPPPLAWGKIFWYQIYPFQAILSNFWFLWQKSPTPPGWGKFFWHQIYPFQPILSNFGFCGRKAPPPTHRWGKFFWHQIYPFQAILTNFGFCGKKAPLPPRMRENVLTSDLSISGNFKQLCFLWQKSPPPHRWGKFFLTPDLSNSGNFEQLWFLWQKAPPPPRMRKKFLTPDLSISGNFEQLWFVEEKLPPPQMSEIFLTPDLSNSGNFEQLWFLWQKSPPPQDEGKFFGHQIYPFQAILSKFSLISGGCFSATKIKVAWNCLKLFISRIFEQLWFLWQKSPPPPSAWGKNFWHQIYQFQEILRNFGLCGRKTTPTQDEGKFFDTRSIHFRQFWATLVFVAEKPPFPPRMRENFLTSDLSISGNFEQLLVFVAEKPLPQGWGKFFWHQIYPFQAILSNFGFCGRKAPPPPTDEGNFFDTRSIHFRQFWATFGFCGRKAPPHRWGKFFWH